jgi:antitoxin (DNA-binding transcriptional repressor) of toxin-antitoxin stability system
MAISSHESEACRRVQGRYLKPLDEVATSHTDVLVTKRTKPVAKLVPYVVPAASKSLKGSVVKETGDP